VTSKRKYEDDSLQRRLESKYGNGCDTTFMLVSEASKNESLAKALGYILGLGSSQVYVPVLIDLWRRRSTDGYSLATFCSTSGGLICNALYSMKRGYHISSYADTLSLVVQGLSCVTFVCILDGLQLPLFVSAILGSLLLSIALLRETPESVLLAIQFTGNALCYYALIPQIMKQFREKTGQWSPITSGLCLFGNLVRVYTTLQQTRDKMILTGYMFGAVAHSILIAQYFLFKS
jgi:hypothetical protein